MTADDNKKLVQRQFDEIWNGAKWVHRDTLGLLRRIGAVPAASS